MPIPLVPIAVGAATGGIVSSSLGLVERLWEPAAYEVSRTAWFNHRLRLATPESVWQLYRMGILDDDTTGKWLGFWGIDFKGEKETQGTAGLWGGVAQWLRPLPGIDLAFRAWAQGIFDNTNRDKAIRLAGADPKRWEWASDLAFDWPGLPQIITLSNRFQYSDRRISYLLDRAAVPINKDIREGLARQRFLLPTPSDLARFLVKDVWDEDIVKLFDLDDDYKRADGLRETAKRLGMEWDFADESIPKMEGLTYWRMLCRAAYQEIAPTMAYRWRHKFREGRTQHFAVEGKAPKVFTLADLKKVLKQADYPPGSHEFLAADSYATPRLVDARNALRYDVIPEKEFEDIMLDRGQTPNAAKWITELAKAQHRFARVTVARLGQWFQRRQISEQVFVNELKDRKYPDAEVTQFRRQYAPLRPPPESSYAAISAAVDVGAVDTGEAKQKLISLTGSEEAASAAFQQLVIAVETKHLRRTIAAVKRLFLQGRMNDGQAIQELDSLQVARQATARFMVEWRLLLVSKFKVISANQVLRLLRKGLIVEGTASVRLENLGYPQSEYGPLIAEALSDRERLNRAKRRQGHSDNQESATRSTLQSWFKDGIIDEATWSERMQLTGVTAEDLPRYKAAAKL